LEKKEISLLESAEQVGLLCRLVSNRYLNQIKAKRLLQNLGGTVEYNFAPRYNCFGAFIFENLFKQEGIKKDGL